MRKSFWIVLALVVLGGAPVANADSFLVSFTTSGSKPTAPDVTFPSPTLDITWQGIGFIVTLPSSDLPTDRYIWTSGKTCVGTCTAFMNIIDSTNSSETFSNQPSVPSSFVLADGVLTFTPVVAVAAPEPSSLALIPLGVGALLLMRKRAGHVRPSAV